MQEYPPLNEKFESETTAFAIANSICNYEFDLQIANCKLQKYANCKMQLPITKSIIAERISQNALIIIINNNNN